MRVANEQVVLFVDVVVETGGELLAVIRAVVNAGERVDRVRQIADGLADERLHLIGVFKVGEEEELVFLDRAADGRRQDCGGRRTGSGPVVWRARPGYAARLWSR